MTPYLHSDDRAIGIYLNKINLYYTPPLKTTITNIMANIQIIVGSVMGTAIEVAKTVQAVLEGFGHEVTLNPSFCRGDLDLDTCDVILACTSNTGMGDLPENITPFYQHLVNDYPQIAGRYYGVINLGDSSYPNFAQAGNTLDHALEDLGAIRIGEPYVMDAISTDDHESDAAKWAEEWNALLRNNVVNKT